MLNLIGEGIEQGAKKALSKATKEAIFKKLAQQDRLKTPYLLGLGTLLGGGAMLGFHKQ